MGFWQLAATIHFFIYGKSQCTRSGWESARKKYSQPDILQENELNLEDRVFLVTGANSGIGRELTQFLVSKNATVYMVCRNPERGEKAREEILAATNAKSLYLLLADVSLEEDVRNLWANFLKHQQEELGLRDPVLHGLVCNAGALLNEFTLTKEGVETTFAAHLLFGTYLLGTLAMEVLKSTEDSRLVVISSGGMYNTAFPDWNIVTCRKGNYDGQFAYARAKRGQVLLCERWAEQYEQVKVVTCHPGWVDTPGVDAAYGNKKSYLEPLRSLWEGTEGIAWLCVAPSNQLESGGFYLDRTPRVKHIAGPVMTEGFFTKNSREQVDYMMNQLHKWSSVETRPEWEVRGDESILNQPLLPLQQQQQSQVVDLRKFMGRWYVWANIPTSFDAGTAHNIEDYSLNDDGTIDISFYSLKSLKSNSFSLTKQIGSVANEFNSQWSLSLKMWIQIPVPIPYLICHVDEEYQVTIIGVPDRSYLWIMARKKEIDERVFALLMERVEEMGFDCLKVVRPPFRDDIQEPPFPSSSSSSSSSSVRGEEES